MNPFHEINTIPLLAILLDATGKGLVLILLAWGVSRLLPRASAAGQHTVWTLAVVALLALPILSAALPQWQLPLLPEWAQYRQPVEEPGEELPAPTDSLSDETGSAGLPPREQIDELEEEPFSSRDNKSMAVLPEETDELSTMAQDVGARKRPRAPLLRSEAGPQVRAWPAWAVATWLAGAAVVLLPLMLGSFTAWRCVRRARPMTEGAWPALLGELADSLRLGRSVRLCQSAAEDIPAVFGLFHPTILVPACADDWSEQRRRVVLLHELAHVKRRDCLTQLLGQLACVLYWFNPLAWLIARQLRIERERACDDLVLSAGQKPSEYADHLLEMVRTLRSRACPSLAAVAMAKKSNFEHRLLAILDAARPRKALTKAATTVAFFAAVAVLLPLAMLHVTTKKDTKNSSRTSSLSDVPTTQPIHDIGFYIITSPESVGRASLASMENLKLAAKPFIGRDDIRYYDWKNHTIHLKLDMKKRFSALMKKRRPTVPFVVVADGRRLYVGMLMNPVSSEAYPDVPIICTELLPAETKRQNTIQIQHPPYKGHDRRDNKILKRVLGEMNLLKADDVPAPPAVRPTVQPTWKDGVLSVDVSNGARVGIVGVSKLGRRPRVWWRADGRKMDAAPYAGAKQKWRYQYEILLRRQADTEVEWIWDVPGAKLFKPGGTPKDKHGKALPNMQSLLVSYDGQRKTTNLRYAVSTGQ
ncbi:MAG: M56 family metallopeptidase, partial [Phycisphaerae bacterium]|nr:M56 family metallopeptidase [Phycisphaerae bacterium]